MDIFLFLSDCKAILLDFFQIVRRSALVLMIFKYLNLYRN